jgi:hypothetical protein
MPKAKTMSECGCQHVMTKEREVLNHAIGLARACERVTREQFKGDFDSWKRVQRRLGQSQLVELVLRVQSMLRTER